MPLGPWPFPDASLKVALTTSTDSCRVWGAAWNPPTWRGRGSRTSSPGSQARPVRPLLAQVSFRHPQEQFSVFFCGSFFYLIGFFYFYFFVLDELYYD